MEWKNNWKVCYFVLIRTNSYLKNIVYESFNVLSLFMRYILAMVGHIYSRTDSFPFRNLEENFWSIINWSNHFQGCYGVKINGIHLVNAPSFVDALITIVKQALRENMAGRLHVHDTYEDLHKAISKDILPEDYGGSSLDITKLSGKLFFMRRGYIIIKINKLYTLSVYYLAMVEYPRIWHYFFILWEGSYRLSIFNLIRLG